MNGEGEVSVTVSRLDSEKSAAPMTGWLPVLLVQVLLAPVACDRSASDLGDGGPDDAGDHDTATDTGTGTGDAYTGWNACVYVFTGWFTKSDDCYGGSHYTSELIELAEDFCEQTWDQYCDFDAPTDPDVAYDCRFAIKEATCDAWEAGGWIDDPACQQMVDSMGCAFPEE